MKITTLISIGIALALALGASASVAKEYNKRQHLAPEQRAKVDRVIAKSRSQGAGQQGDVSNVGCGKLEIGNVEPGRGDRKAARDNIVVITGDVINVAQGCRNTR